MRLGTLVHVMANKFVNNNKQPQATKPAFCLSAFVRYRLKKRAMNCARGCCADKMGVALQKMASFIVVSCTPERFSLET